MAKTMTSAKPSLADRLEAYFKAYPNVWHDGHVLIKVAGTFGLRSRISDVRARGLKIENRISRYDRNGVTLTRTEYRFVPPMPTETAPLPFGLHADSIAETTATLSGDSGNVSEIPPNSRGNALRMAFPSGGRMNDRAAEEATSS